MTPAYRHWSQWLAGLLGWAGLFLIMGWMTAQAQQEQGTPCGPYDQVAAALLSHFGEIPFSDAMAANQMPVRTFVNPQTWTWTTLILPQPGLACIVLGGDHFGMAKPPEGPPA